MTVILLIAAMLVLIWIVNAANNSKKSDTGAETATGAEAGSAEAVSGTEDAVADTGNAEQAANTGGRGSCLIVLAVLFILFCDAILSLFMSLTIVLGGGFGARIDADMSLFLTISVIQIFTGALIALVTGQMKKKSVRSFLILVCAIWVISTVFFAVRVSRESSYEVVSEGRQINISSHYRPYREESNLAALSSPSSLILTENCPVMDGATALYPLYAAFAQAVYPEDVLMSEGKVTDILACSTTKMAYRNLIDGKADIIFVAEASEAQMQDAAEEGVELIFTPIGSEAFVFFVNSANPVETLTVAQLRDIYSGKIRNWAGVGIEGVGRIRAFQRREGSGSQTIMVRFMGEEELMRPETESVAESMGGLVEEVADYRNAKGAIGYTFRFYLTQMTDMTGIKLIALEGVEPTEENIRNGTYPMADHFYAVTRSDASPETLRLLEWLTGPEGQELVEKTGYTPLE